MKVGGETGARFGEYADVFIAHAGLETGEGVDAVHDKVIVVRIEHDIYFRIKREIFIKVVSETPARAACAQVAVRAAADGIKLSADLITRQRLGLNCLRADAQAAAEEKQ